MIYLYAEFLKQYDSVTAQNKAHAEAENVQFNTHESISVYGCCAEYLVIKDWPKYDAKMRNREYVNVFLQGQSFKLEGLANEKKLDQNPTKKEPVVSFEIFKNIFNRRHISNEKTPKPSDDVNCFKSTHRYQHHSLPQVCHQRDPEKKTPAQFYKFCNFCQENGPSMSTCSKRQTNHC